jgi:hypothetical protein
MPEGVFDPTDPMAAPVGNGLVGDEQDEEKPKAGSSKKKAEKAQPNEIKAEGFAEALTRDPCCGPMVKAFAGYAGPSDCPGFWRLYSSLEFNEYIEFAIADVVNSTKFVEYAGVKVGKKKWDPITRTIVWLKAGAIVRLGRVQAFTVASDFLRGQVTHDSDLEAFSVGQGGQGVTGPGSSSAGNFSSRGPC